MFNSNTIRKVAVVFLNNDLLINEVNIINRSIINDIFIFTAEPVCQMNKCSKCGHAPVIKFGSYIRSIRDFDMIDKRVIIKLKSSRYYCKTCGATFSHSYSFVNPRCKMTNRLREKIEYLSLNRPLSFIAKDFGFSESCINNIATDHIAYLDKTRKLFIPEVLGIDEAHLSKATCGIFVDIKEKKIIELLKSNKYSTMKSLLQSWDSRSQIKAVVIDMNTNYRELVREMVPNALIVVDKFHVIKDVQNAFESEIKQCAGLIPGMKGLVMRNPDNLSEADKELYNQSNKDPLLEQLYYIKNQFENIYNYSDKGQALIKYEEICSLITDKYVAFNKLIKRLDYWKDEIFNYYDAPYDNGVTEGFNRKIKNIETTGAGYSFNIIRGKALYGE